MVYTAPPVGGQSRETPDGKGTSVLVTPSGEVVGSAAIPSRSSSAGTRPQTENERIAAERAAVLQRQRQAAEEARKRQQEIVRKRQEAIRKKRIKAGKISSQVASAEQSPFYQKTFIDDPKSQNPKAIIYTPRQSENFSSFTTSPFAQAVGGQSRETPDGKGTSVLVTPSGEVVGSAAIPSRSSSASSTNFIGGKRSAPFGRTTEVQERGNIIFGTKQQAEKNPFIFNAGDATIKDLANVERVGTVVGEQSRGVTRQSVGSAIGFSGAPQTPGKEQQIRALEAKKRAELVLSTEKQFQANPTIFRGAPGFTETKTEKGIEYGLGPDFFPSAKQIRKQAKKDFEKLPTRTKQFAKSQDLSLATAQLGTDTVQFFAQGVQRQGSKEDLKKQIELPGALGRLSKVPTTTSTKVAVTGTAAVPLIGQGVYNIKTLGLKTGTAESVRTLSPIQVSKTRFTPDISKDVISAKTLELPVTNNLNLETAKGIIPQSSSTIKSVGISRTVGNKGVGVSEVVVQRPTVDITGGRLDIGTQTDTFVTFGAGVKQGKATAITSSAKKGEINILDAGQGSDFNLLSTPIKSETSFKSGPFKGTQKIDYPGESFIYKGGSSASEDLTVPGRYKVSAGVRKDTSKFDDLRSGDKLKNINEVFVNRKEVDITGLKPKEIPRGSKVFEPNVIAETNVIRFPSSNKGGVKVQSPGKTRSGGILKNLPSPLEAPRTIQKPTSKAPSGRGAQDIAAAVKGTKINVGRSIFEPGLRSRSKIRTGQIQRVGLAQGSAQRLRPRSLFSQLNAQRPLQKTEVTPAIIPAITTETTQVTRLRTPTITIPTLSPPRAPGFRVPKGPGFPPILPPLGLPKLGGSGKKTTQVGRQPFGRIPTLTGSVQYNVLGLTASKKSPLEKIGGVRRVLKK